MEELDAYIDQTQLIDQLEVDRAKLDQRIQEAREAKSQYEREFIHSHDAMGLGDSFVYQRQEGAYLVTGSQARISLSRYINVKYIQVVTTNADTNA